MKTPKFTLARLNVVAALASSVLLSAGCGNMQTTASSAVPVGAEATLTGRVHGGNQPVAFAAVQLFAVGQSGVGQGAVLYATTYTATNGTGSFSFTKMAGNNSGAPATPNGPTYQCPTGVDPLMYIYSRGGNTTNDGSGLQNTSAAFLAPVGYCSQINSSTFIDVSEVTTVATVAATAQFINPTNDTIGNDGIGVAYAAIGNAFKTIPNLVSAATGLTNATSTIAGSGTGVSGVTMTVTAPAAQLNTMANIISACVNQQAYNSANNCSTLFANSPTPSARSTESQPGISYPTAGDTVEAALYMILNPSSGGATARTNLFNLQAAAGAPYGPILSAAPNNWLLALTYSTLSTCGAQTSNFLSHPYDLNADINGNLWIANHAGGNAAISEISPNGQPETCVSLGASSLGGGVVDTNGSIWYADNQGGTVYTYNPANGTTRSFLAPGALAITADGSGNIFFTTLVNGTGSVYEIVNAVSQSNTSNPVMLTNTAGHNPARIFPDSAEDIWVTSGSSYVTELTLSASSNAVNNYVANQISVTGPTYGITVGSNNRIYISSQDPASTVTVLSPPAQANGSFYPLYTTSTANTGGTNMPTSIWIDGAQNSWVGSNTAETSGLYSVSQLTSTLSAISASGTNGGYQFGNTILNAVRTTTVDSIGNVWVLSDNLPNTITEILGAAVPIYAPYSQGIVNSRFQTIP